MAATCCKSRGDASVSSTDEYVSNSQSNTETEEEDSPVKQHVQTSHGGEDSTTEEEIDAYMTSKSVRSKNSKRTNKHLATTPRMPKKAKMARNKSHASKVECCDVQEIKKCLCSHKACCRKKCLRKLKDLEDRGILALSKIRHQRFAGPLNVSMKISPCNIPPRG